MSETKDKLEDAYYWGKRKYQWFIDRVSIYPRQRWLGLLALLVLYGLRVATTDGYAVITYLLGLYYLN